MKSTLLKATVLATGAIAMGALASPASAKTFKYTFATNSGAAYCDGITVTTTDKVNYSGTHTGSCVPNVPADGFASRIKGYVPVVNLATTNVTITNNAYSYIYSSKVMAWELFTDEGGVWTAIASGRLLSGAPESHRPGTKTFSSANDPHPHQPRAGEGLRGASVQ
jgi:hypothetical protein